MRTKIPFYLLITLLWAQTIFAQGIDPATSTALDLQNIGGIREIVTLDGRGDMSSLAFSPSAEGLKLAAASFTTIQVFDIATGEVTDLDGHNNAVTGVAFGPDGFTIVSGGRDNTVRLWDMPPGEESAQFAGHTTSVNDVDLSPDGALVASASDDMTVKLWEVMTGVERVALEGHTSSVMVVVFSPNSRLVASGGANGVIRLWNTADGSEAGILEGHNGSIGDLAFSPDGTTLASGGDDGTVRLWQVSTGRETRLLEGHEAAVTGVAFHPSGEVLATASFDSTLRVWNMFSFAQIASFPGPLGGFTSVTFAPDGLMIAAGGSDSAVHLWGISSAAQGVIGTVSSAVNAVFELNQIEPTCVIEAGENVLAIARSPFGDTAIYAGGEGCEGAVWLTDTSMIEWSDAEALNALTTVQPALPPQVIRDFREYDGLCANPVNPGAFRDGGAPYTVFDPEAPRDFYPPEVVPTDATGVDTVLCRVITPVDVETCTYDGGASARRVRMDETYILVEANDDGGVIARETFDGNAPPECPDNIPLGGELTADPLDPETTLRPWLMELLLGRNAQTSSTATRSIINGNNVNVRSGPGQGFAALGQLQYGTPVNLIGRTGDNGWVVVLLPDMSRAWVSATLVQTATPINTLPLADGDPSAVTIPIPG